jgi:hypothetical protein
MKPQPQGDRDITEEGEKVVACIDIIAGRVLVLDNKPVPREFLSIGFQLGKRRMAGLAGHLVLAGERRHSQELDRRGLKENEETDEDEDGFFHF